MNGKWITIATLVLAAACAPMTEDELAATGGAPYSSDDEEQEPLERVQQAVTFDPSCAQWQRDVLGTANFYVWALANEALTNWSHIFHVNRQMRWFGPYVFSIFSNTLRARAQAIHDVAWSGGPTTFYCSPTPYSTLVALAAPGQGRIHIFPEFWNRALGTGDNAEPVPGTFPPGSQVGILIHEYAHYVGAPGETIGPAACKALSNKLNTQSYANADNWRMYLMDI
jgi:hypothetical protein